MKRKMSAALACAAALTMACPAFCAAEGNAKGNKVEVDTEIRASAKIAFEDVDESSAIDWGAASDGPEFGVALRSSARARMASIPWLAMGPSIEVSGEVDTDVYSTSGDPYIAISGFDLRALAGWGADASIKTASGKIHVGLSLVGGMGVFDLSDADSAYLPAGSDAGTFWFRVDPAVGAEARFEFEAGRLEIDARERYLATWEAETASGFDWDPGFEERFEAKAVYEAPFPGPVWVKARASGDLDLESGVIVPSIKYSMALRCDIGWKDVGALKLSPAIWSYKAELPDLGELSTRRDEKSQLSGKIEWETDAKDSRWSLSLRFPWLAYEDGEAAEGEWELGVSLELEQ
jgi:hypothetical protein